MSKQAWVMLGSATITAIAMTMLVYSPFVVNLVWLVAAYVSREIIPGYHRAIALLEAVGIGAGIFRVAWKLLSKIVSYKK